MKIELESRIARLERTVKLLSATCAVLVVGILAGAAYQGTNAKFDQVTAKSVVIVDSTGARKMTLGTLDTGAAHLTIHNSKKRAGVMLSVNKDDLPTVVLNDPKSKAAIQLQDIDGAMEVTIFDADEKIVGSLPK